MRCPVRESNEYSREIVVTALRRALKSRPTRFSALEAELRGDRGRCPSAGFEIQPENRLAPLSGRIGWHRFRIGFLGR